MTATVTRVLAAASGEPTPERLGALYQAELARDRDRRKAAGAYYTPAGLVALTCGAALDPLLETRADPLDLRIIDPAAGAGIFLVAALERIAAATGAPRAEIARRCLRGVDVDPGAAALCRIAVAAAAGVDPAELATSIICADALLDDVGSGYDAVIGNPPWGQKAVRFSAPVKAALRDRYATATGVLDPFKLFVERAHQIARPGGRWSLVLPDIILLKNQEPVRALILAGSRLALIAHAGRAFDGVNLDAVVIAGELGAPPADHEVEIWCQVPPRAPRSRRQAVFAALPNKKLNLFASDRDLARVEALRGLPRFGDRFEIHEGVHTGNCRDKLFLRAPRVPCARLIRGGAELRRGELRWGGGYIALDPAAIDREAGDYANLGRHEWHARKKIAVRRTGDRVVAAADLRGYWFSNNAFVALPRAPMDDRELAAHAALLNGDFMTWYFRAVQPRVGRLFAELEIHHLADFPVPPLDRRAIEQLAAGTADVDALYEEWLS